MDKMKKEKKSFSNKKPVLNEKEKKISFFSAILLVIGSTIGAGIFVKNEEIIGNNSGILIFVIISWLLSIIAVVCMGISLIEINSASKNANLGVIGWIKDFGNKFLFKSGKYFMAFIYLPINLFVMPLYVVQTIQDAFGWQTEWWISFIIALSLVLWFTIISGFSTKALNIQNWIITSVKFIPIVFAILIGFILYGINKSGATPPSPWPVPDWNQGSHQLLTRLVPGLGIIGSLPSIIFSFDGFYTTAGMQSEMKKPEKTGLAIVSGLLIVSVIDLLITVSLLLCSTGKVGSITFFNEHRWVLATINIMIAFGILGIINGYSGYNPRYYEGLIYANELKVFKKWEKQLNPHRPVVGVKLVLLTVIPAFIVLSIIGAFAFIDTTGYGTVEIFNIFTNKPATGYNDGKYALGGNLNNLYSFCDTMANWTSILIFGFITVVLIGGIINRKTKKLQVKQLKGFTIYALISSIIIGISIIYLVVSVFVNIALVISWHKDIGQAVSNETYQYKQWIKDLLGVTISLGVLILFIVVMTLPSYLEIRKERLDHNRK